jgi:uncharacterized membrane protein
MSLLLFISILPFPTLLLGKYPNNEIALTIYGSNLLAVNLLSFRMLRYIYCNRHLANEHFKDEFYKSQFPIFLTINGAYVVAIICAFFAPQVSYAIFILMLVLGIKLYVKRINAESKLR